MSNVVQLIRTTETSDERASSSMSRLSKEHVHQIEGSESGRMRITSEELYPEREIIAREVSKALHLLREADKFLADGERALINEELLESDVSVERFFSLIPELSCCRTIGDGFGAVVQAMYYSLYNNQGMPLNAKQIDALRKAVLALLRSLYPSFENALDIVDSLASVGFNVEPDILGSVSEMLINESLS